MEGGAKGGNTVDLGVLLIDVLGELLDEVIAAKVADQGAEDHDERPHGVTVGESLLVAKIVKLGERIALQLRRCA